MDFHRLCRAGGLGSPISEPEPVGGGALLHRVWRVTTTEGTYAVKVLNPQLSRRPGARDAYRTTERIAAMAAAAGLPAIAALEIDGEQVPQMDGSLAMVYPWVEGRSLSFKAAEPGRAFQIGTLLAQLHTLQLQVPDLDPPPWHQRDPSLWGRLAGRGREEGMPWAGLLSAALPGLRTWEADARRAGRTFEGNLVASHRDLDQTNVIWHGPRDPALIDWEAAGLTNPAVEAAGTALVWAGLVTRDLSRPSFIAVLDGYRSAGGSPQGWTREALTACMGGWLGWLEFNLRASLGEFGSEIEEQERAARDATRVVKVLHYLEANLGTCSGWLAEGAGAFSRSQIRMPGNPI